MHSDLLVTIVVLTAALALGAPARYRSPLLALAAALLLAAAASQSRSAALGPAPLLRRPDPRPQSPLTRPIGRP